MGVRSQPQALKWLSRCRLSCEWVRAGRSMSAGTTYSDSCLLRSNSRTAREWVDKRALPPAFRGAACGTGRAAGSG